VRKRLERGELAGYRGVCYCLYCFISSHAEIQALRHVDKSLTDTCIARARDGRLRRVERGRDVVAKAENKLNVEATQRAAVRLPETGANARWMACMRPGL
jgi:hypothetical protein